MTPPARGWLLIMTRGEEDGITCQEGQLTTDGVGEVQKWSAAELRNSRGLVLGALATSN